MYTQVTFGDFLTRILEKVKRERGIEFDRYPNIAVHWDEGDWLYQICNDFSVRVFRWLRADKILIEGPYHDIPPLETQEDFEARFEVEFNAAVDQLMDHL
jgi:hypothetical protein